MHAILFSLWFFVPAGFGNMTPVFAAHIPLLRDLNYPLDFGKKYRKQRIFGVHKTWRGVVLGVLIGMLIVWVQSVIFHHSAWIRSISTPVNYRASSILVLGLLLSLGALIGDAIESFVKRQRGIGSGDRWFPFDQLDYVIGGILLSILYVRLPLDRYVWIIILWFGMHLLFSYIGYLLKLKSKPI